MANFSILDILAQLYAVNDVTPAIKNITEKSRKNFFIFSNIISPFTFFFIDLTYCSIHLLRFGKFLIDTYS